jgi:hypothetical protein
LRRIEAGVPGLAQAQIDGGSPGWSNQTTTMGDLFQATFDDRAEMLLVRASGEISAEHHVVLLDQAVQLCESRGWFRLLFDLRELTTRSIRAVDNFAFGERLAAVPHHLRVVNVMPSDGKAAQDVHFAAIVAANRGRPVREFQDLDEARSWLLAH